MSGRNRSALALTRLAAAYLLSLLLIEFVIAERNPITALVTYIPQHPLLLPLLPPLLLSLLSRQWKLVVANLLLLCLFLVLLMGFNARLPASGDADLRVMTINLARSAVSVKAALGAIAREKPDIIFIQEARPLSAKSDAIRAMIAAGHPSGVPWRLARTADVAIASRRPLTSIRSIPLLEGSGRRLLIAQVVFDGRQITVACAHFSTNLRGASRRRPMAYLRGSARSRIIQVRTLLAALPARRTVIAGDFNLPPRGIAFSMISRKYKDTFSRGSGFGYTYRADLPVTRIDHVFVSKDLAPAAWRAVDTGASDHRAVVAEIELP
ncbi:MAG: endonuclease/exonuclease/phosphatase family protein [Armatimonadota bacterium]|nr:endonuclease/exonuclease/phosphatase family protein [Armatimonadota bacterium]